jgi:AAA+ superfamily predicted ATPase
LRAFQKKDDLSFFTLPISDREGISVASTATALMALIDCNELDKWKPEDKRMNGGATSTFGSIGQKSSNHLVENEETKRELKAKSPAPANPSPDALTATTKIESPKDLFTEVVKTSWKSSGLRDLNAFSTCMVIRAAGFLVSSGEFTRQEVEALIHQYRTENKENEKSSEDLAHKKEDKRGAIEKALAEKETLTLRDAVNAVAETVPESFKISTYPAKATMAYWFVDGITKAGMDIPTPKWKEIAVWAVADFDAQLRYLGSNNDPLMDPPSLAMSAALLQRLRTTFHNSPGLAHLIGDCKLPGQVELTHAVEEIFKKQTNSGIWHKYFPLFHFPKSGAADYTFSFEFLEAILLEFSDYQILAREGILNRIESAVQWCASNRFEYRANDVVFSGWNAGGDVDNLAAGMPEAWATASVHMFLWELESALSTWLQDLVLARFSRTEWPSAKKWDEMINVDINVAPRHPTTLKDLSEEHLLNHAKKSTISDNVGWNGILRQSRRTDEQMLRRESLKGRISALLFGPPGTSKTSFAKAIAGQLKWPLIIVTPSDFLSRGLEQIYVRASEIFDDLMDLSAAVILFDEMDALAQTRVNPALDVTRQMLTTSMLPKLADLHDRARVIFLMATNHKKDLDPAITRPGRFDLLICMGPPNWQRKLDGLELALKNLPVGDHKVVRELLKTFSDSPATREQLDLFTVGDFRSFIESLVRGVNEKTIEAALKNPKINKDTFQKQVSEWAKSYITLSKAGTRAVDTQMDPLTEFEQDQQGSRIQ